MRPWQDSHRSATPGWIIGLVIEVLAQAIQAFARDRQSGAAELAREAVRIVATARRQGATGPELSGLREQLALAHPAMAAVWNALHANHPEHFIQSLDDNWRRAAHHARTLLRDAERVVTLSYSSTVLETLAGRPGPVIVGQSLPGGEGERTARLLQERGTPSEAVPDATLASWVAAADAVVLGADAVTGRGIVNKVGSRALALAARLERCPCYVLADSSKLALPAARFPPPLLGPGAWFEYLELGLVTRVVTEHGALTPRVVYRLVRE